MNTQSLSARVGRRVFRWRKRENSKKHNPNQNKPMLNREYIAQELYTAYCAAVGGVNFQGHTLPDWKTFSADPAKQNQAEGWRTAADRALQLLVP